MADERMFETVAEAKSSPSTNAGDRLFRVVRPNGETVFVWSSNTTNARALVTKLDGYVASVVTSMKRGPAPSSKKGGQKKSKPWDPNPPAGYERVG